MTRLHLVAAAGAAAVIAAAPAVAAVPAWNPGLRIAPLGSAPGPPAAALADRGEAVAAWTVAAGGGRTRVEVRHRHGFTAAWTVALPSGTFGRRPSPPGAGANPAGAALVVWRAPGGDVRAAYRRTRTGGWTIATVPAGAPAAQPFDLVQPSVAVAADGSAHVLWAAREAGGWVVRGARRSPAGAWTATAAATAPDGAVVAPRIALTPAGEAVAAWVVPEPGREAVVPPPGRLLVATRPAGGEWTAPVVVADGTRGVDADVAAGGGLVAAWGTPGGEVALARGTVATGPGAPAAVAPGSAPRVALNPAGAAVLTWAAGTPSSTSLRAAVDHGAGWTPPATLAASPSLTAIEASSARVEMGPTGTAVVAWLDPEGPGSATAGVRNAGRDGVFRGPDQPVGRDDDRIAVAVAGGGTALALFPAELAMSNGETVFAASLDASPRPRLGVTAGGTWRSGRREATWTVTVRNRGPVAAQGVRLTLGSCCGTTIVAACPAGVRTTTGRRRFDLGTIRPGAGRVVRVTTRTGPRVTGTVRLFGDVAAIATVPVTVSAGLRR